MSTQIQGFDEFPQMLTVDQLVKMLQLPSKETVYFWNKYGKGPCYYRGGQIHPLQQERCSEVARGPTERLVRCSRAHWGRPVLPASLPLGAAEDSGVKGGWIAVA
jgi:hypothetical protein